MFPNFDEGVFVWDARAFGRSGDEDSAFVAFVAQGGGFHRDFDASMLAPEQTSDGLFEGVEHSALHG